MRAILLGLGLVGLMVGSAHAADRWPAEVCQDIQARVSAANAKFADNPGRRADARGYLLGMLLHHCGIDVSKYVNEDFDVAVEQMRREEAARKSN